MPVYDGGRRQGHLIQHGLPRGGSSESKIQPGLDLIVFLVLSPSVHMEPERVQIELDYTTGAAAHTGGSWRRGSGRTGPGSTIAAAPPASGRILAA
jgi:hypothetical protein